jgi:hypothetical protein
MIIVVASGAVLALPLLRVLPAYYSPKSQDCHIVDSYLAQLRALWCRLRSSPTRYFEGSASIIRETQACSLLLKGLPTIRTRHS